MKNNRRRWTLNKQSLALTVLPIIGLCLVIMSVVSSIFNKTITEHVNEELENVTSAVLIHFDLTYPGDYCLKKGSTDDGQTTYDLLKGDSVITQDYDYIDSIKQTTGIDITIFYKDTRILTTIRNPQGERYIGTAAHPIILDDVLYTGKSHFYNRILINSVPYFAHYQPLCNADGEITGMIFAGKPSTDIQKVISSAMLPIIAVSIIASLAIGFLSTTASRRVVFVIQRLNNFLSQVAIGNLNMNMDSRILSRKDELGDIGWCAVNMQRSLRTLIEQDSLTGLYNRRYADKRLQELVTSNNVSSPHFTIALGDIDYFKRVNDTYGHSAGDVVLKGVADLINKSMKGHGYAARWGGEEFLFIFEDLTHNQSLKYLNDFICELRQTTFMYKDIPIQVTMTLGVTQCQPTEKPNILVKRADDKLYQGKTAGRDRIIT